MVWITAVALVFIVTVGWYIGMGVGTSIADGFLGSVTGSALSLRNLIEYALIVWGPAFDALILLWAFVSSQTEDNVSRYM